MLVPHWTPCAPWSPPSPPPLVASLPLSPSLLVPTPLELPVLVEPLPLDDPLLEATLLLPDVPLPPCEVPDEEPEPDGGLVPSPELPAFPASCDVVVGWLEEQSVRPTTTNNRRRE